VKTVELLSFKVSKKIHSVI